MEKPRRCSACGCTLRTLYVREVGHWRENAWGWRVVGKLCLGCDE
jgi:hypothetical protein